jgi:hypothetical protein
MDDNSGYDDYLCIASRLDWLCASSNIRLSWGAPDWISVMR